MTESPLEKRRRWIALSELIALLALIVSAVGVWVSWKGSDRSDKPAELVEAKQPVPLVLRGKAAGDGRSLDIAPVEQAHALESLTIAIKGASPIDAGSDGQLRASDVEAALGSRDKEPKDKDLGIGVRVQARYVEGGVERTGGGSYTLRYRWQGGGLFGGRSLRLVSLGR